MSKYPKEHSYRGGCKVSWLYYTRKADAERAAKTAKKEAERLWSQGYDFGYQMPGAIAKTKEGLYEVCIP